jgi:predicted dehydrogenase
VTKERESKHDPLTCAVVGLGYWGPNLVRNLNSLAETNLITVCDVREDALTRMLRQYPSVRGTTSFEDVLADETVDAVVIATPVRTHSWLAAAALTAGKHVFVEKPLASSIEEAESLIAMAAEQGLVLMPGHVFLYSPPVNVIRSLIEGDELGDIYFISTSRVNLGIHQSDASVVWDLGPHDFSILRYWLGELPERVSAVSRACVIPDVADVAFVSLQFPSGALAHVEMSWLAPSKLRRTAIVGSRKMVVYDDTSIEPVRIFDSGVVLPDPETFGEYRLTYRTGEIVSPPVDAREPLSIELNDFCRAVRGRTAPRSSATLGLDVVRMIDAVERSLAAGGVPVFAAASESRPGSS